MRRFDGVDSLRDVPPPPALSALNRPELEALLLELFGEVAALNQVVAEQREEIARLKGLKGRPTIKPSGMDKGTGPPKPGKPEQRRGRGKVRPRVSVDEKVIEAAVPPGSRFKGYEPFLVQDLVITVRATCYRRERWVTPDGRTILAPLPEGVAGHFGPELRRFVLMQYHQGQSEPAPAKAGAAPAAGILTIGGGGDLGTSVATAFNGQTGWVHRRGPGGSPRGAGNIGVCIGGRHRRASRGKERVLHADWR